MVTSETITEAEEAGFAIRSQEDQRACSRALIRILLVDDHALMRDGTAELLGREPDIRIMGQAATAEEGLVLLGRLRPDVAIVDVNLPDRSGLALAKEAAATYPEVRILILSAYDDYSYVVEALQLGVRGYLLKTSSAREFIDAVRMVANDIVVLTPALSARLGRHARQGQPASSLGTLSARETEVLALIVKGRSNKEIASALCLGQRTIEGYVSNLLLKLGVSSRTQAMNYALSHHLVALESLDADGGSAPAR